MRVAGIRYLGTIHDMMLLNPIANTPAPRAAITETATCDNCYIIPNHDKYRGANVSPCYRVATSTGLGRSLCGKDIQPLVEPDEPGRALTLPHEGEGNHEGSLGAEGSGSQANGDSEISW